MPDYTSDTRTIQSLLASTVENTLNSTVVQAAIFEATPIVNRLRTGGNLKVVDGGERLRIAVDYAKNNTAKYYNDLDALDVTRSDTQTAAFYNWKQASASIVISGKEMRINKNSKTKLFDLLNARVNNAAKSLTDLIATGVFSDGTGSGSKQVTGLEAIIETTPGTAAYASIPTSNTAWRNRVATSVGAASVNLVPNLRTVSNQASQGGEGVDSQPNLYVATRSIHESYEALMFPQVRYEQNPSGGADAGINVLKFKGQDFIWSTYCTSGTVYVLNLNHLYMFVHRDANFSKSGEGLQKPINQDSMVTQVLFMGNLLCDNRRKQGKLTGVT
jgi:hypothetical protein